MKKFLIILLSIIAILITGSVAIYIATGPEGPASGSPSAGWLEPGPFEVGVHGFEFVDDSRPTNGNRGYPALPVRTFIATLWYPVEATGSLPLIVHSHGIMSLNEELAYAAQALASHGYVVLAADFPLTHGATLGGANGNDVINQPADISFLIDTALELDGDDKPFTGEIDPGRIGLTGFSLGGLTTYLATFHGELRDPRVAAAVAIAGPSAMFSPQFFATTDAPLLAIAGTADGLVEYQGNAADIPQRAAGASLLTIDGGSHMGFAAIAEPTFRFVEYPDFIGCGVVMEVLDDDPTAIFAELGGVAMGVDMNREQPGICDYEMTESIHPGRQHMITTVAIVSFFESVFSEDAARRAEASEQLRVHLSEDFPEVTFEE